MKKGKTNIGFFGLFLTNLIFILAWHI